jgi:predicted DsbA family dithiol-disulfide isomerase
METRQVLVLFHDYTSPASAVAIMRLQRLMREGMSARIRGTEVMALDATLPVTIDMLAELEAVADEAMAEHIELRRPAAVPPTGLAHVVEDVARRHTLDMAWREQCYRAYWSDGANIGDGEQLRRLAARAGLPAGNVDRALDDRLALLEVRRRSAGDRRNGIGGVPTIEYNRTLIPGLLPDADLRALTQLGPAAT